MLRFHFNYIAPFYLVSVRFAFCFFLFASASSAGKELNQPNCCKNNQKTDPGGDSAKKMTKKKKEKKNTTQRNEKQYEARFYWGCCCSCPRCYRESCPIPIPIPISCRLLRPSHDHRHLLRWLSMRHELPELSSLEFSMIELSWAELSSVELSGVGFWFRFSWEILSRLVLCGIGLFGFSVWLPLQRKWQIRKENALIFLIYQQIE